MRGEDSTNLYQIVHQYYCNEQNRYLKPIKVQGHVLRLAETDPANDDHKRENEECDLQARANGDTDGKVHLVFDGDGDGCGVLGCVADDGQENETDEFFRDSAGAGDGVDGADHVLSAQGDENGGAGERD